MALHPLDVLVALKLAVKGELMPYAQLASELGISASQAHAAVRRAGLSRLVDPGTMSVDRSALVEFLLHGLKYMCPPEFGPVVRGLPTSHSASPLRELLSDDGSPLVWPDPEGHLRGESINPLYKSVPFAARKDPKLYAGLALLDAVRAGRARERRIAAEKLEQLIRGDER